VLLQSAYQCAQLSTSAFLIAFLVFPRQLKSAVVTPLFKKGDAQEAISYRPISVTNNISKIIERIIADQINLFMEETNQLAKYQFDFRAKHSISDALIYTLDSWRNSLDNNENVAVVSLDLSKAFDSIDHHILMNKLTGLGFEDRASTLIRDFLSGRTQAVKTNDILSDWLTVIQGVPQGTILGPLLFLLYVNDMSEQINSEYAQFADDTLLFFSDKNPSVAANTVSQNCEKLIDYLCRHKLSVNVKKQTTYFYPQKRVLRLQKLTLQTL
jgi:hypothetical protein